MSRRQSSLDYFKTPTTSAGDVTPPPGRRTCRGVTTRRHQYKKDDYHRPPWGNRGYGLPRVLPLPVV
ncbi:jg4971 [Pararge aegeria aegeria]|uniref:Jg4971 protein n=1 Tax=Pararge aegeria aegeria TaxID=348720 RepID=A0A8S4SII4_9NEOP|nr:jg4971 [Pararge aegeria aegeria]